MSDEFQPDNWPEEYFENPPLEQIIGHGNDRGTIDVYRCEDGLVWHTTHEKCDYHGPTGPRTKANFRLTDVQEFAIAKDLASHFPSTQRRALLSHLLKAEGLPGVEEIERKPRPEINPVVKQLLEKAGVWKGLPWLAEPDGSAVLGYGFHGTELLAWAYEIEGDSRLVDWEVRDGGRCWVLKLEHLQQGSSLWVTSPGRSKFEEAINAARCFYSDRSVQIRQTLLPELLEAEARERVETWVDDDGDFCARIDDYYYVILDEDGDIHFPCVVADPDDRLIYGIAAALAEKRRRESEVSDHG